MIKKIQQLFRRLAIVIFSLIALAGIIAFAVFIFASRPLAVLDQKTIEAVNFPIYVPKTPPNGFKLQEEKTKASREVVSFVFNNQDTDKQITVSVQPRPADFDMAKLIGSGSINSVATNNGTLYDLSAAGSSKYLLNTGDSLVFFTSPQNIDTATINSLANSLAKQTK